MIDRLAVAVAVAVSIAGVVAAVASSTSNSRLGAAPAGVVGGQPVVASTQILAGSQNRAARRPSATPAGVLVGWSMTSVSVLPSARANQGVATLVASTGRKVVVTRGLGDIAPAVAREGWVHVGDPGGWGGYLVDAYQAAEGGRAKMFLVTVPGGRTVELVHPLSPGEMVNNSFAAISPDGRWLVSGEWRTVHSLRVFALPRLTPTLRQTTLVSASPIGLTRPLRNVQGCAFDGPVALVCTTDDPGVDLFPVSRQVVRVELSHVMDGRDTIGRPTLIGAVPEVSSCPGHGEPEGVDVTDGILRFTVVEPPGCRGSTRLYVFTRSGL